MQRYHQAINRVLVMVSFVGEHGSIIITVPSFSLVIAEIVKETDDLILHMAGESEPIHKIIDSTVIILLKKNNRCVVFLQFWANVNLTALTDTEWLDT